MASAPETAVANSIQARLANVRYAEKDYWNSRYKSQPCEFDWFYGYTALRKIVRAFIKRTKSVLHVGCGNSNFQEGMAKDGYQVVNTDISEVVIEQMRAKHKHIPNLRYVVSDCRSMPEFLDCQFGSVIDKGTVDALLCSKDAANDIRSMFREISRVLIPGGVFLLVTLGAPSQRLSLVNRPEFDWSVQVCLVRRVPEDQYAPSAPGRAIPLNDTAKPLSYLGPLEVQPDGTIVGLPEPFDPASFFYAYVCRRSPLVLPADNQGRRDGKARLPEGWRATVRAVAEVVSGELKLPQGILGRGRRVRTTSRATFEREQQERELERERERQAAAAAALMASGSSESQLDVDQLQHLHYSGRHNHHNHHHNQHGSHYPDQQQQQPIEPASPRPQTSRGLRHVPDRATGVRDDWPEPGGEWGSGALEGPAIPQQDGEGEVGRSDDGEAAEVAETRRQALVDPLAAAADDSGAAGAAPTEATADGGGSSAFRCGMAPCGAAPAVAAAAPPPSAAAAGCSGQARLGRAAMEGPIRARTVSYRRLSASVQDAFAFLDAIDGTSYTGCSRSNGLDTATAGGGGGDDDDDRDDRP
ncbi:hypothetical protein PLESTB_000080400 [Pleodorina starrii]|uniref:Methyltransferase type 11 domain-containing protein n=1 Tax=Pleodorina starrii TaxID=330485 RepID=A0A9W6B9Y3_9CHLO|nr:hypothetical protein PLESTM_000076900 [Pleodorina starrii]GLC48294.1 hypothetical protein PLESTB_000080400 [Pleodorina starrii]GLC66580.1 hypothetical protein PLESTF_000446300 [Pleodorina starrii]